MGQYPTNPGSIRTPAFKQNPLVPLQSTGQGSLSHPVPPKPVRFTGKKLPAPTSVQKPGAFGTI